MWESSKSKFNIPDIPDFVPLWLKPWIFIVFVLIIQFSGGIYLASASDMVGSTALMQEDILMAGYASLIGMAINFAVMFRIKFRYSNRTQLLVTGIVLIIANMICSESDCAPVLWIVCLIAGWFRMQGTLACNSTIQLWITPKRDMSVFFCFVYLLVDGVIQLSGIATVYTAFFTQWENMHWIMIGLLALMMVGVLILVRPVRGPMYIPLLGIDWLGAVMWSLFMLCFTFICVYGDYYDWWDALEIRFATLLGLAALGINLLRMTFLHHPYISFAALKTRNVWLASGVYLVFFTLASTEHVFEPAYASMILGFDSVNVIDLNLYVLAGIIVGCIFTYLTFARHRWRYKTMTIISFCLIAGYLAWFYFSIGHDLEKEALFFPLFLRGAGSVIVSIVFLTSIKQSGLPFKIFPQALTLNGFTGAVMGVTLGPALVGEWLQHTLAKNIDLLSFTLTTSNPSVADLSTGKLMEMVQTRAMIVSMKEIYGWLLIIAILSIAVIAVRYSPLRPWAIFPKWKNIRRILRKAYGTVAQKA